MYPLKGLEASKRKRTSRTKSYESDDSSASREIFDTSSCGGSIAHNFICASASTSTTVNEIREQENFFPFSKDSGPQCSLIHEAKPTLICLFDYFN
jgi:hypothetical protein